jgi:hypothetical protein
MKKCGIIKKVDNKPCTKEGKDIYGGKCGNHKNFPSPEIKEKSDIANTLPKDILNIIGRYINLTDYDLNYYNLDNFRYLIETFHPSLHTEEFSSFFNKICSNSSIHDIEIVKSLKTWYPNSPCLNDAKYLAHNTIFNVAHNADLDLLTLLIEMYKPNMIEKFFSYVYVWTPLNGLNVRKYIFNLPLEILKCIFDQIEDYEKLEEFLSGPDNNWDLYFNIYTSLLETNNTELTLYIDGKLEESMDGNFYKYFTEDQNGRSLVISSLINALHDNDLKLADFIWNDAFYMKVGDLETPYNDSYTKEKKNFTKSVINVIKQKCMIGGLSVIQFIFDNKFVILDYEELVNFIRISEKYNQRDILNFFVQYRQQNFP